MFNRPSGINLGWVVSGGANTGKDFHSPGILLKNREGGISTSHPRNSL